MVTHNSQPRRHIIIFRSVLVSCGLRFTHPQVVSVFVRRQPFLSFEFRGRTTRPIKHDKNIRTMAFVKKQNSVKLRYDRLYDSLGMNCLDTRCLTLL